MIIRPEVFSLQGRVDVRELVEEIDRRSTMSDGQKPPLQSPRISNAFGVAALLKRGARFVSRAVDLWLHS